MAQVPAALAAAAAVCVGLASAATLTVAEQPTLANIVIEIPGCGEERVGAVPISWSPEPACDAQLAEEPAEAPVPDGPAPSGRPTPEPMPSLLEPTGTEPDSGATAPEPQPQSPGSQPEPTEPSPQETEPNGGPHD